MSPELATAIIVALGGASIIPKVIDGFKKMHSGRAREEKQENRTALGRLYIAEERADNEAAYRRLLEESCSLLRRMLIQAGVPEDKLPAWPTRPGKLTSTRRN